MDKLTDIQTPITSRSYSHGLTKMILAKIYGDYITPNFVRISDKLDQDKTSFIDVNGCRVHSRHFIWLRMGNNFQSKVSHHIRGDDVDTTLTIKTRQFVSLILVRVWNIVDQRRSSLSLGWAKAHLTTLSRRIIPSTSSIESGCMLERHSKVATWWTINSSSQTSPSGSWTISSKSS